MQQKADEKMDPLTRIQEEIKEVVRREEEYRQLVSATALTASPPIAVNFALNGNASECEQQLEAGQDEVDQGVLVTAQPASVTSLLVPIEEQSPSNTPSLASSVNSNSSSHKEESLDEHHSDDSGISASSQKTINNNVKTEGKAGLKLNVAGRQESRYIGPNCYNMTPEPPQQKLLTRTPGTPQLQLQKRQFAFNGATKGVMQRFIASHGKLQLGQPAGQPMMANGNSPTLKLNSRNALAFLESGQTSPIGNNLTNNNNNSNAINGNNINGSNSNGNGNGIISISNNNNIERDSEGRPLRRGYVPVEQKIQRELQDLKSRETELKRLRKLNRQHLLEKLQCTDEEADADDDEDDSEEEHCYGPGKLRNAQSTLELEKDSNDLELMGHKSAGNRSLNAAAVLSNGGSSNGLSTSGSNSGMRPAMSLAQLCDLTPEEAPSSHRLIAQWESLIKKNAEGIEAAI